MKSIPKKIYGCWRDTGYADDTSFSADETAEGLVQYTGESLRVGIYELVGYAEVKNATTTVVKPLKSKRK